VNLREEEIFDHFLTRNDLTADTCLFIDDNRDNVTGAQRTGMAAIHFESPQQLRRDFARRGLLD
jgi:FMN phosphatase YigB (HAD superfamily)